MRTTMLGDIVAAARVLLAITPGTYPVVMDRMLEEAHIADLYIKRLGRPHPHWGNGNLMGRAVLMPQIREPFASDYAYLTALMAVIEGLLRRISVTDSCKNSRTVEVKSTVI